MRLELDYYIQIMLLPIYEETAETVSINPLIPQSWGTLGSWGTPPDPRPRLYRGTSFKKLYYLIYRDCWNSLYRSPRPPAPLLSEHLFLSGLINTIGYTYHTLLELSSTAPIFMGFWEMAGWFFLTITQYSLLLQGIPVGQLEISIMV